jgi:formylglycine-generating enzyme required for sulfatase activity
MRTALLSSLASALVLSACMVDVPLLDDSLSDRMSDSAPDVGSVLVDGSAVDAARPDGFSPDGGGSSLCPADMVTFPGFCMDRYEAPNERGVAPLAMRTAKDGSDFCAARGKRLCTEAEWVRACQGAAGLPYPYGKTYQKGRCVDDKVWKSPNWTVLGTWPSAAAQAEAARLYQAEPSGQRRDCVAEDGVYDLTGNVAEWVIRSFPNGNNYEHVMKGCYWAGCYGGSAPSCGFVNPAHPGTFRSYEAGFRCCKAR